MVYRGLMFFEGMPTFPLQISDYIKMVFLAIISGGLSIISAIIG